MQPTKQIVRLIRYCAVVGLVFMLAGCFIDVSFGGITLQWGAPLVVTPPAPSSVAPSDGATDDGATAPKPLAGQLWRFDLASDSTVASRLKSRLFVIDVMASQDNIFSNIADPRFQANVIQHGVVTLALGREVTSVTDQDVGTVPPDAKWILLSSDPGLLDTEQWSEMVMVNAADATTPVAAFTIVHELLQMPLPLQSTTTPTESLRILTTTVDHYVSPSSPGKELWIDYVLVQAKDALGKPTWLQYDFIGQAGGAGSEIKRKKCCQKCGCCDGDTSDYCQQRGCVF